MGARDRDETVLHAGKRPRRVTAGDKEWTAELGDRFAEVIAETCNVTLAARAIGRSVTTVYRRRARDASFRGAWDAALVVGYSQLEMMLLERALHGVEKVVVAKDGTPTTMREYCNRTALALLRLHRERVTSSEQGVDAQLCDEARERVLARIERLRTRVAGNRHARRAAAATSRARAGTARVGDKAGVADASGAAGEDR